MTRASASPQFASLDAAPDVALGAVTIDVAALAAGAEDCERWIRVTPRGAIDTRDDRHFNFEPERLVARFDADGIDVPIDFDHAIPTKAKLGEKADAVGWIKQLQARADGTYALVELLAAGAAALKARTHRFVSPTFTYTKEGLALWLHSVALVAAPALAMPAIASASLTPTKEQPMLKAIAKALGLAETADEAACLAAIGKLSTTDPLKPIAKALGLAGSVDQAACLSAIGTLSTGKVDKLVHDQALANLTAATTQVASLQAQLAERSTSDHKAKVEATIEAALTAKKIVPAQREHYTTLCATAEGLAQVTALLGSTPAGLQSSALDTRPTPEGGVAAPDTLLAKAYALIETAAKSGRTLSLADAVVQANKGEAK
ncbi:phage I-like protein [Rhodopseudomonas rhenobacensis]|uniref:Phage I-like protein n=1 Tax=Rhodopseudomonas rhenobacensis TaxID=87461 RepID=A0A7W7Z2L0_9BRAD|nr:phage protease [Rhodopseudomonas rhenobacensis]MBB5046784.1 phage I-like protein [Rhodopseudomonas rhenobacensis]